MVEADSSRQAVTQVAVGAAEVTVMTTRKPTGLKLSPLRTPFLAAVQL